MFRKLRHIGSLSCAMIVLVMGLQSALDTPHDFARVPVAVHQMDAAAVLDPPAFIGGAEHEHEHEASADHAVIMPGASEVALTGADRFTVRDQSLGMRTGHLSSGLERPPRPSIA